jgi:hypothetical protein
MSALVPTRMRGGNYTADGRSSSDCTASNALATVRAIVTFDDENADAVAGGGRELDPVHARDRAALRGLVEREAEHVPPRRQRDGAADRC